MTTLPLHLTIAGTLLVGLGAAHLALPAVLGWRRDLAAASALNREVSYVHCYFVGLSCVLWGLLPLTAGSRLLQPDPVTRLVLAGAVCFWASRLLIQLVVFNRHAARSAGWLALSTAGTLLWLYLTLVWTWALALQRLAGESPDAEIAGRRSCQKNTGQPGSFEPHWPRRF